MKKIHSVLVLMVALCASVSAQTPELTALQQKFRSFDYNGVIELANELLTRRDQYVPEQLVTIYEMKAMAHYSKSELDAAQYAFEAILKLDPNYTPDPVQTSPKIIDFFNAVKKDVKKESRLPDQQVPVVTDVQDTLTVVRETLGLYKKSVPASMLLPGAGHLLMGETKRGIVLTGLSVVTLSSAVYATGLTRQRQQDYLNSIDEKKIASAYKEYNDAYKARNALWIAYAAVWFYTQTDLLFFHDNRQRLQLGALPAFSPDGPLFVSLTLAF